MQSLLFLLLALCCLSTGLPADFEARVEELVNTFMGANDNPGLGLTIVTANGSLTFSRGYGYQDLENQIPMNASNLFCVASISKSFVATLASRMLNEKFPGLGEGALDAAVTSLAPNLNITFIDRNRAEGMSFRDILSHRTCLSTNTLGRTMGAYKNWDEFVYRTRYVPAICPYKTGYHYNNNMFGLAGEVVGRISGSTYESILLNFLKELGMNNTKILNATENYDSLPYFPRAYFKNLDGKLERFNPELIRRAYLTLGSSGVVTTPEDFVNYLRFRLNNGKLNGKQIVPENVMNWVKTPANPFNFGGYRQDKNGQVDGDFAYALGLNNGFYRGYERISHDGYWPPFSSRMSLYPSLGIGIFSSTNGPGRLSTSMTALHNSIVSAMIESDSFAEIKRQLIEADEPFEADATPDRVSSSSIENPIKVQGPEAAGKFGNPFHGEMEIIYDSTDPISPLRVDYGIWGKAHLIESSSSNILRVQWDTDVVHDYLAASGSIPTHTIEFLDVNTLILQYDGRLEFIRNASLSTLPEIPWESSGCEL